MTAIANQNVCIGQCAYEAVQRVVAVATRKKEIGITRKCLNRFNLLQLLPKPYAFPLDQLHRLFFMTVILEAGEARKLRERIDLPRLTFRKQLRDSRTGQITEP